MAKKCPICEGELLEVENGLYCSKDDLTFLMEKGKVKVKSDSHPKGKLQEIEEDIAELRNDSNKMKEKLFGDKEIDLW